MCAARAVEMSELDSDRSDPEDDMSVEIDGRLSAIMPRYA